MAQKDVGNKVPIHKLKTTAEVNEFYDDWGDKDKYNKDMLDWSVILVLSTLICDSGHIN